MGGPSRFAGWLKCPGKDYQNKRTIGFTTRALGGQAVWNGRDYQGRKIETGIYLVPGQRRDHRDQFAADHIHQPVNKRPASKDKID